MVGFFVSGFLLMFLKLELHPSMIISVFSRKKAGGLALIPDVPRSNVDSAQSFLFADQTEGFKYFDFGKIYQ